MSADLDIEKKAIMLEFRERVSDVLHSMKNDFMRSDEILEKFLTARGYNFRKAEEMFRKTVEWRQADGVETILERPFCHQLDPYYKVFLPGFDKLGHPLFITQPGQWDILGLIQSRHKAEYALLVTQFVEKGLDVCRMMSQNGRMVNRAFIILDCAGLDYKLLASPKVVTIGLSLLRENCQMVLNYYPELIQKVVIVNVTPMFQLIWTIIKPVLPRATLSKVAIYGTNENKWKNHLLEHIDPNVLPSQYGGADITGLLVNYYIEIYRNYIIINYC